MTPRISPHPSLRQSVLTRACSLGWAASLKVTKFMIGSLALAFVLHVSLHVFALVQVSSVGARGAVDGAASRGHAARASVCRSHAWVMGGGGVVGGVCWWRLPCCAMRGGAVCRHTLTSLRRIVLGVKELCRSRRSR